MNTKIKTLAFCALLGANSACGYTSKGNEAVGQVKRVHHDTPLICPDFDRVDISMGVMREGVGSMSTHDVIFYVPKSADYETFTKAAEVGKLVKITYDVARVRWCTDEEAITSVTILDK